MRRHPTSLPPRLPDPLFPARVAIALVFAALALLAVASASADTVAKTRVTVIGDSVTASIDYVPAARRVLGKGFDLRSDAVVCRRLVAASCPFKGTRRDALDLVGAHGRHRWAVACHVGYNDLAASSDSDRVMRPLTSARVRTVVGSAEERRRTRTEQCDNSVHGGAPL